MSNQNAKGKLKYEAPILMSLGEMGKGAGADCSVGSSALTGYCRAGSTASPLDCTSVGTSAGAYCSAGTSAQTYCSAGNTAVTEACSGGNFPGA